MNEYLLSHDSLKNEVSAEFVKLVEQENSLISEKVNAGKFAYLVIKHKHYLAVNEGFARFNSEVREKIRRIKDLESRIVSLKEEASQSIERHIYNMLTDVISIDENKPCFQ